MCHSKEIALSDLPDDILDQYSNDDHGQFLVAVFPAGSIWQDAPFLNQFADDVESVSDKATGIPPVFRALIPFVIGVIWMVGLMYLTRQQFTVMNVIGLPMILGIGIDDGVHAVHRWISKGKRNLYTVFAGTGKVILLISLTTMLAFGPSSFPSGADSDNSAPLRVSSRQSSFCREL